ncbi:uncharacterized protein LOC131038113 [Cryptomeria japonica]|uniref:uncharacterized protein LOC131038113 n=1 Tax=Cryptomeria japonica TaxID=3369 RepID=UPI0027DAAF58|nr:uncharacterized protein LOC131038113 [Cryptomeria japonica]
MEVMWEKPSEGWWKINFDEASKGNLGPSGEIFIVRDWKGDVLAMGAKKIENGTNNVVEALIALTTIKIGKKLGAQKVHLEGDSLITIQAIIKESIEAWNLQNSVEKNREELSLCEDFRISHFRRSGNMEADILSKWDLTFENVGELRCEDFR